MKRQIIKIDEEKCTGCGDCIPNCHEGALQIIDGKVRLVSDLMCDGLGACLGHCPEGALEIEEREAVPYDEVAVMAEMVSKGRNVVIAHLEHLLDHNELEFHAQGVEYLEQNKENIPFEISDIVLPKEEIMTHEQHHNQEHHHGGGCPSAQEKSFKPIGNLINQNTNQKSELTQWPVQMHLVNPMASYFRDSDFLLAADCVAFSLGNFHSKYLKGKSLGIACPKLDSNLDIYVDKITKMIDDANLNTITVMIMEVPCCGGLMQIVKKTQEKASRKIPVKVIMVGNEGDILSEKWM
jgi:NAD-dependent dihydropyrimidine dehydrogenase PreA subunit